MQAICVAACHPQPISAQAPGSGPAEVARGDAAGRAGAQPAELVGLDDRDELGLVGAEEHDGEARAALEGRVDLDACIAELDVRGGHVGK